MSGNSDSKINWFPGQIWAKENEIKLFEDKELTEVTVSNTGDRPIQVGSHFHFFETNKALSFDRKAAYGKRLAIASGTAVRFEPGQSQKVFLLELAGDRTVYGLNALVSGRLDDENIKVKAFKTAKESGFKGSF
jgi:urease subunit gamma/beta